MPQIIPQKWVYLKKKVYPKNEANAYSIYICEKLYTQKMRQMVTVWGGRECCRLGVFAMGGGCVMPHLAVADPIKIKVWCPWLYLKNEANLHSIFEQNIVYPKKWGKCLKCIPTFAKNYIPKKWGKWL